MEELFKEFNLSNLDKLLLIGSPICSIIGSLVHAFTAEMDINEFPKTQINGELKVGIRNHLEVGLILKWLFYRLFVGAVIGFVFALYFIGITNNTLTSIARLLAFSVLIGFSAPKLWASQEKILTKHIDLKLKEILNLKEIEK